MLVEIFNTHAVLNTDDDDLFAELRTFFSITDRKFNPRAGHFDELTCFILPDGTIPIGLLSDGLEHLAKLEVEYEIQDYRRNIAKFDQDKLRAKDKPFGSMLEHQAEALITYAERLTTADFKESAIFDHATNSGKSYIIAALLDALVEGHAFVVVHDSTLYLQLIEFLTNAGFQVGYLRGQQVIPGDVIVCMYKSMINRFNEIEPTLAWLISEATLLIVDECHRAAGNEYYMLINSLGVATRIGFSGTPFAMKSNLGKIRVMGCFGDIAHRVSAIYLNQAGINAKMKVELLLHTAPLPPGLKGDMDYHEVYRANIIESVDRLNLIVKTVAINTGNIMITVNELSHAALIYDALIERFPDDEIIALVGGRSEVDLAALKSKFSKSTNKRVVLITTIWQEGANIAMDVLIYAQGGASEIELTQYVGRIGRLTAPIKHIYDFYDYGKFAEPHSNERIAIYEKLGLEIKATYEVKAGTYEPSMAAKFKNIKLF